MLIKFKNLKQGDIILHEGCMFKLCNPTAHIFSHDVIYTVFANFIERRKINKLLDAFNKRSKPAYDLQKGINLQGFAVDTLNVIEQAAQLQYA